MKLDGPLLDLTSAVMDQAGQTRIGWRRRIEVREDSVTVSVLAPPEQAGIGIGDPVPEITVHCKPSQMSVGPISWGGWLALNFLEPGHAYWLELRTYGLISLEREDGDPAAVWHRSPIDRASSL